MINQLCMCCFNYQNFKRRTHPIDERTAFEFGKICVHAVISLNAFKSNLPGFWQSTTDGSHCTRVWQCWGLSTELLTASKSKLYQTCSLPLDFTTERQIIGILKRIESVAPNRSMCRTKLSLLTWWTFEYDQAFIPEPCLCKKWQISWSYPSQLLSWLLRFSSIRSL